MTAFSTVEAGEADDEYAFGSLFATDEIRGGGGRRSKITREDVELAGRRVDASGVVPKLQEWWDEDTKDKRGGGRPSVLSNRDVLTACFLLIGEGSPIWITELANIFWFRLTDEARQEFGLSHIVTTGVDERDFRDWYARVWRVLHRIIDLMDAWPMPARNKLLDREQREQVMSLRDKNIYRLKRERGNWFTDAMLEMTFQSLPRRIRREWGGAVSIDQTVITAPSQKGRRKRDKQGRETALWNAKTGDEIPKWVLEIDAEYYPVKSSKPRDSDGAVDTDYQWVYVANLAVQTQEVPGTALHPQLVISASLSTPNKDIGGEVVRAMQSIRDRGHNISRLTTDRGYGPNLDVDNFHIPLKVMGIPLVMDYDKNQKGVKKGWGGALQVEGAHYCPATPENLLSATVDIDEGSIDYTTYAERIDERRAYKLRAKERPDYDGHVPMVCPAHGAGATLLCPLKPEIHPKASKKMKPTVTDAPEFPDTICKQTSVDFPPEVGIKFEQSMHYASPEWAAVYSHDRNSVESYNGYIKLGPEQLDDASKRRLRGMAAQQFLLTMLLVSANLRKVARFLRDEGRETPKKVYPRRRDTEHMSRYVRWREKIETTTKKPELTAEART